MIVNLPEYNVIMGKDNKKDTQYNDRKGIYTYPNGSQYSGELRDNQPHGKGILIDMNGSYEGDWQCGKKHGWGIYKYKNEDTKYVVFCENDKMYLEGNLTNEDGSTYAGTLKYQLPHGKGVYTYKDGSQYEGEWKNGKKDNWGTFTDKNGMTFPQYWKNGQMLKGQTCDNSYKNTYAKTCQFLRDIGQRIINVF